MENDADAVALVGRAAGAPSDGDAHARKLPRAAIDTKRTNSLLPNPHEKAKSSAAPHRASALCASRSISSAALRAAGPTLAPASIRASSASRSLPRVGDTRVVASPALSSL